MEKISVIVTIYNDEDFLNDCLNSIIHQTYANLEIILVDDGSHDRSLAICQQYIQYDPRICLYQEKNAGAGAARNLGVKLATGNYIMFVDGDDTIGPELINLLYQKIQHDQSDLACCMYYRIDEHGTYSFYTNEENGSLTGVYYPQGWIQCEGNSTIRLIYYSAWGKLYNRSLFHNVEFPTHVEAEDWLTTWKLFLNAHKISYINVSQYCWRFRPSSTSMANHVGMLVNWTLSVQERAALFPLINVHSSFLRSRWLECLNEQRKEAQRVGDQYYLSDANLKFQLINKYQH